MERNFNPTTSIIEVTNVEKLKLGDRAYGSIVLKIGKKNPTGSTNVELCDSKHLDRCLECVKTYCPHSQQ